MSHHIPFTNHNIGQLRKEIFQFNREIARINGIQSLKRFSDEMDIQ